MPLTPAPWTPVRVRTPRSLTPTGSARMPRPSLSSRLPPSSAKVSMRKRPMPAPAPGTGSTEPVPRSRRYWPRPATRRRPTSITKGHVLIALQNALYQALHAATVEDGVVATVSAGGDTDTNAAIAGALLGALHGARAAPAQWQRMVLTCRPRHGAPGVQQPRPPVFWQIGRAAGR